MLTLYQAPRGLGEPNLSPFCTKLEAYLRMAQIPYEVRLGDIRKAPNGKVPWIEHEGRRLGDSSLIIDYLKQRFGDGVDQHLTPYDHAIGRLIQRTLEEGTYWVSLYDRWVVNTNFERIRGPMFGKMLGRPLIWVVPDLVRKRVLNALYAQGTSRHSEEEVYAMGRHDFEAISVVLGDKPFLFGEQPSSYDAVVYAFTVSARDAARDHRLGPRPPNLLAHMERMHERYFKDVP
jgi:glutathione S-transferase